MFVVLIQDPNQVLGNWKLGKESEVYPGDDARVRKVDVEYQNPRPGEPVDKYEGRGYIRHRTESCARINRVSSSERHRGNLAVSSKQEYQLSERREESRYNTTTT